MTSAPDSVLPADIPYIERVIASSPDKVSDIEDSMIDRMTLAFV
jgi:hypothetical protein